MAAVSGNPRTTIFRAFDELDTARSESDTLGTRQAAEKAWLAVVQATDRFLGSHGIRVPTDMTAHAVRRAGLRRLGEDELARTYSELSEGLHGDMFYFGENYPERTVAYLFREAAGYVAKTTGDPSILKELFEARARKDVLRE